MSTSFQTWLGVRYGTAIAIGALQRQLVDDQSASDRKRSSVLEKGPVHLLLSCRKRGSWHGFLHNCNSKLKGRR